ncbi:MAG: phospholipase A [Ferruginibacter sp.]
MNRDINKNLVAVLGFYFFAFSANAQTNPLFNDNENFYGMTHRWELDSNTKRGTFIITPYRPIYIFPGRWSSNPNESPASENPNYVYPFKVPLNKYEAKFQLSFKTKILQGIFWNHGDLWVGYTQRSHWQIYNQKLSRPFRETNYEPELILNFATNVNVFGFKGRMAGIAFTHQSNGRAVPLSRSWNRVIGHIGFERKNWSVILRGWYRLKDEEDENPAISNYMGRGDAQVVHFIGRNILSLRGVHSLKTGNNNHGLLQFDWSFPVAKNLKGHFQLMEGYGETLIDYNHRQTIIGLGISLVQ